jgi:hypothetical protein
LPAFDVSALALAVPPLYALALLEVAVPTAFDVAVALLRDTALALPALAACARAELWFAADATAEED